MTLWKNHGGRTAIVAAALILGGLVVSAALSVRSHDSAGSVGYAMAAANAGEQHGGEAARLPIRVKPRQRIEVATTGTFDEQVLRSPEPVLVDFYADWCGPCQTQGRILEDFAAELEFGKIVKVNVDDNAELAEQFRVRALPTLLVFQNGRVIGQHVGLTSKGQLRKAVGR